MTRYSARVAAARLSGRRRAFPVAKPSRRAASIGAAPAYLERHGTPRGVDELRGHAVIAYLRAGSSQPWDVVDVDGQIRRAQIQPQFGFDDMTGIVDAVLAGVGLAWLPAWLLARYARTGELVTVMEHCFRPTQEIHLVWPKSRYLPLKTRWRRGFRR